MMEENVILLSDLKESYMAKPETNAYVRKICKIDFYIKIFC